MLMAEDSTAVNNFSRYGCDYVAMFKRICGKIIHDHECPTALAACELAFLSSSRYLFEVSGIAKHAMLSLHLVSETSKTPQNAAIKLPD